jgi:hypothetical protein
VGSGGKIIWVHGDYFTQPSIIGAVLITLGSLPNLERKEL